MLSSKIRRLWARAWMSLSGPGGFGRLATRMAALFTPPYKSRCYLASCTAKGYIAPNARIFHGGLQLGENVFIGDRVVIYQARDGGPVELAHGVHIHTDTIIETGEGGCIGIGAHTSIQPRCQFSAYKAPIRIGSNVQIAPNCALYPYNHGLGADQALRKQPLQTKGGIVIDDDVWLGVGVIVLDGVKIGKGAVIGAGAVVTHDIPEGAVAVGVPARVVKFRGGTGNDELVEYRHTGMIL